jgi:hypothetical protein
MEVANTLAYDNANNNCYSKKFYGTGQEVAPSFFEKMLLDEMFFDEKSGHRHDLQT